MELLLLKFIAAPLLLVGATIVIRRWGESVGGFLVGLPLTSGPISIFLAVENGPRFAMQASAGSLIATASQVGFCATYCLLAARGCFTALAGACTAFVVSACVLQGLDLPAGGLFLIALLAVAITLYCIPHNLEHSPVVIAQWWEWPVRMMLMIGMVAGVTLLAPYVGARVSGVLASFPCMATILVVFAHRSMDQAAAKRVMRGMVAGLFGFAVFFYVLNITLTKFHLAAAYGCALVAASIVQMLALQTMRRRTRFTLSLQSRV